MSFRFRQQWQPSIVTAASEASQGGVCGGGRDMPEMPGQGLNFGRKVRRYPLIHNSGRLTMIDVHYWTTPNGHKVTIFLEEAGLKYKIFPVNIGKGEQFKPDFLAISPNNRIPAIVDHDPPGGGKPISVFESGAILFYLANKTGKFIAKDMRERMQALEWLFWQMGGLGPMAGQYNHFGNYAPEKIPYAIDRYRNEVNRLYGVMNKRLADRDYLAGEYSIADMACYPWVVPWERQGQNIADFPHLKRWLDAIAGRDAVKRAYAKAKEINPNAGGIRTAEERAILFGQTAKSVESMAR
jgi:GSH-dependent disulfide-bond oxidoreductase